MICCIYGSLFFSSCRQNGVLLLNEDNFCMTYLSRCKQFTLRVRIVCELNHKFYLLLVFTVCESSPYTTLTPTSSKLSLTLPKLLETCLSHSPSIFSIHSPCTPFSRATRSKHINPSTTLYLSRLPANNTSTAPNTLIPNANTSSLLHHPNAPSSWSAAVVCSTARPFSTHDLRF